MHLLQPAVSLLHPVTPGAQQRPSVTPCPLAKSEYLVLILKGIAIGGKAFEEGVSPESELPE